MSGQKLNSRIPTGHHGCPLEPWEISSARMSHPPPTSHHRLDGKDCVQQLLRPLPTNFFFLKRSRPYSFTPGVAVRQAVTTSLHVYKLGCRTHLLTNEIVCLPWFPKPPGSFQQIKYCFGSSYICIYTSSCRALSMPLPLRITLFSMLTPASRSKQDEKTPLALSCLRTA